MLCNNMRVEQESALTHLAYQTLKGNMYNDFAGIETEIKPSSGDVEWNLDILG